MFTLLSTIHHVDNKPACCDTYPPSARHSSSKGRPGIGRQVKHGALKIQDHEFPIYKLEIRQVGVAMVYTKGVKGMVAPLRQGRQLP